MGTLLDVRPFELHGIVARELNKILAPARLVRPVTTLTTHPTAAHGLILAVLEWAVGPGLLRRCIGEMPAGRLNSGGQVYHGRRAVMPVDGRMRAWMAAGMSMAHGDAD